MVRHACGARMGRVGGGNIAVCGRVAAILRYGMRAARGWGGRAVARNAAAGWHACLPALTGGPPNQIGGSSTALGALSVILLVKPPAGRPGGLPACLPACLPALTGGPPNQIGAAVSHLYVCLSLSFCHACLSVMTVCLSVCHDRHEWWTAESDSTLIADVAHGQPTTPSDAAWWPISVGRSCLLTASQVCKHRQRLGSPNNGTGVPHKQDLLQCTRLKNYVKHRAIRLCCRGVRYRGEAPVPHLVDGCSCDYHKLFMNEPTDSASVSVAAEASFSFSQSASPSSTSAGGPSSSRAFPVPHNHQRQHEQGSEIPGRRS